MQEDKLHENETGRGRIYQNLSSVVVFWFLPERPAGASFRKISLIGHVKVGWRICISTYYEVIKNNVEEGVNIY
jgi:hypothetical protein